MKLGRLFYCLFVVGVLLTLTTATALAWPVDPPDRATISGPGLKGEVEVTDKEILAALSLGAIEDFERGAIPAPKVSEGYQSPAIFMTPRLILVAYITTPTQRASLANLSSEFVRK